VRRLAETDIAFDSIENLAIDANLQVVASRLARSVLPDNDFRQQSRFYNHLNEAISNVV
jgi:hypothetical protein